jgi:hypothetical protein
MLKNIFFILFVLWGCGKDSDYLHHRIPKKKQVFQEPYQIQEVIAANKIDILWVVDNSGSMSPIQNNIINNAKLFMEKFTQDKSIDWKMGVVSTDGYERPFLGFGSTPFNSNSPDPVTKFQSTISSLGINGSGSEYVFYNADRHLFIQGEPFLRKDAHLAIIMVSDEEEQSDGINRILYEPLAFYDHAKAKLGAKSILRFYGALGLIDLGCTAPGDNVPYAGSPYEKIVNISKGFTISACSPNFGNDLARIGKDIASLVQYPKILLSSIPKVDTIVVSYKGKVLPYGAPETGGYWYYDYYYNAIVFYNLDFADQYAADAIDLRYDVDDGYPR